MGRLTSDSAALCIWVRPSVKIYLVNNRAGAQLRGLDPHARRPPAPVTITDLAVVRRLAVLVDSLQLSTIGPGASCPAPCVRAGAASLAGGVRQVARTEPTSALNDVKPKVGIDNRHCLTIQVLLYVHQTRPLQRIAATDVGIT